MFQNQKQLILRCQTCFTVSLITPPRDRSKVTAYKQYNIFKNVKRCHVAGFTDKKGYKGVIHSQRISAECVAICCRYWELGMRHGYVVCWLAYFQFEVLFRGLPTSNCLKFRRNNATIKNWIKELTLVFQNRFQFFQTCLVIGNQCGVQSLTGLISHGSEIG